MSEFDPHKFYRELQNGLFALQKELDPLRSESLELAKQLGSSQTLANVLGGVGQLNALLADSSLARELSANRVFQVAIELPWTDAAGERAFGDFIDHLYFLLYEGAGQDRLRYLSDHGGPLDATSKQMRRRREAHAEGQGRSRSQRADNKDRPLGEPEATRWTGLRSHVRSTRRSARPPVRCRR